MDSNFNIPKEQKRRKALIGKVVSRRKGISTIKYQISNVTENIYGDVIITLVPTDGGKAIEVNEVMMKFLGYTEPVEEKVDEEP